MRIELKSMMAGIVALAGMLALATALPAPAQAAKSEGDGLDWESAAAIAQQR